MERLAQPVTLRTLIVVAIGVAVLSVAGGAALASAALKRGSTGAEGPQGTAGPAGPEGSPGTKRGPRGPKGPEGPAGSANDEAVYTAIDSDPGRVAGAIQGNLDPDPSDVQSQVEDLQSSFDDLCQTLQFAPALNDEVITC